MDLRWTSSATSPKPGKKLGNDVLLMGNVDTYAMTCDPETPVETTVAHIKEIIDNGVDAVMPGCDLWPAIMEANMKAVADTTHEYGKKASPLVGIKMVWVRLGEFWAELDLYH